MSKLSDSPANLLAAFPAALQSPDKMRGWKRSLTLYKRRRSQETGRPESRFVAGVKASLVRAGFDVSSL